MTLPEQAAATWVDRLARLSTPERGARYALLMLALTLGGGVLNLALGEGLLDRYGNVIGGDFLAFYTGARFFWEDRLPELYSLAAQARFEHEILAPQPLSGPNYFINPPYAVVLYAPFGLGSYAGSLALWWLCGSLAGLAALEVLRRELPRLGRVPRERALACSLLFFPTVAWLLFGQSTTWSLLVYTGCFVLLRRGHDARAGAVLALLAFKPQLALAPAMVLAAKGRWRALAAGAAGLGGWLLLGAVLAPDATHQYAELSPRLFDLLRGPGYDTWGIHSLFGFATLLLGGISLGLADAVWIGTSLALAGAGLWFWWGTPWTPGSRAWDLAMAATFAGGLLLSPHLFTYDLMLLLLPFAIAWCSLEPGRPPALDGGPLLAASGVLWLAAFLSGYATLAQLRAMGGLGLPELGVQLSTLAIAAWALAAAWHSRTAAGTA